MLTEDNIAHISNVIHLNRRGPLSLAAARKLIPLVYRVTERWHKEAHRLAAIFENSEDAVRKDEVEEQLQQVILTWTDQIRSIGGEAKGPWLVDFDTGKGFYWCWRYPERELTYYHTHEAGFAGREPINERMETELQ